jgi:hypothetical protein
MYINIYKYKKDKIYDQIGQIFLDLNSHQSQAFDLLVGKSTCFTAPTSSYTESTNSINPFQAALTDGFPLAGTNLDIRGIVNSVVSDTFLFRI